MKKLLLILFIYSTAVAQESNLDWILSHMMKKSPESYKIFKLYNDLPQELSYTIGNSTTTTTKYIDEYFFLDLSSKISTLRSMSTNIHEVFHGLSHVYFFEKMKTNYVPHDFQDITTYFYITDEIDYVSVFKGEVFPSSELDKVIPKSLITFRYDTYITGSSSTQGEGIIGLLNEFNAYYHDSKFTFDMLPIYKTIFPDNYLMEWVMDLQSVMTAFYEFDFWIKEYILHAKLNFQSLYFEIMKKDSAFKIYKDIHKNYNNLISKYSAVVKLEKMKMEYTYDTEFWEDDYFRLINRLSEKKYSFIEKLLN